MKTLSEALAEDGVTLAYESEVSGSTRIFSGVIQCEGRSMRHEWSQSAAALDVTPSPVDILGPAIRHSMTAEAADGYEDWASDFSSDPEDWMPEKTYRSWLGIARELRRVLGDRHYESYSSDLVHHDD